MESRAILDGVIVVVSFILILELLVIRIYFGIKLDIVDKIKKGFKRWL